MHKKALKHFYILLSSNKLSIGLISSYLITVIFSYYFLSHSVDDIFYFGSAVNIFENGKYAIYVGDKAFTVFYLFPTFSLLNSFFLEVTDFLSIDINHLNYRLFSKVILLLLFFSILYYVHRLTNASIAAKNLAIIILMTSPYMLGSIGSVRPEPLGVLLICLSLIFFSNWKQSYKELNLILSNFFLGLACITHPIFIIPSMLIGIHMLVSSLKLCGFLTMVKSFFVLIIPVACYLIWLILNFDEAYIELSNRFIESNSGLLYQNLYVNIFSTLDLSETPITTAIYRLYFSFPFYLVLGIVIYNLVRCSDNKRNPELIFGIVGAIINFIFIPQYDFHFALLVFFTLCIASSLFYERNQN